MLDPLRDVCQIIVPIFQLTTSKTAPQSDRVRRPAPQAVPLQQRLCVEQPALVCPSGVSCSFFCPSRVQQSYQHTCLTESAFTAIDLIILAVLNAAAVSPQNPCAFGDGDGFVVRFYTHRKLRLISPQYHASAECRRAQTVQCTEAQRAARAPRSSQRINKTRIQAKTSMMTRTPGRMSFHRLMRQCEGGSACLLLLAFDSFALCRRLHA